MKRRSRKKEDGQVYKVDNTEQDKVGKGEGLVWCKSEKEGRRGQMTGVLALGCTRRRAALVSICTPGWYRYCDYYWITWSRLFISLAVE